MRKIEKQTFLMTRTKAQRVIKYTTLLAQTHDGKFSLSV